MQIPTLPDVYTTNSTNSTSESTKKQNTKSRGIQVERGYSNPPLHFGSSAVTCFLICHTSSHHLVDSDTKNGGIADSSSSHFLGSFLLLLSPPVSRFEGYELPQDRDDSFAHIQLSRSENPSQKAFATPFLTPKFFQKQLAGRI